MAALFAVAAIGSVFALGACSTSDAAPASTFVLIDGSQSTTADLKGKVTLVEFSDFACGYCKQSEADVAALIAAYPGMRVEADDYGNTNHYTSGADKVGLRFSVGGDGRVGEIYAGRQPFLAYAEGCA
mgnify:CR=1 FL=1